MPVEQPLGRGARGPAVTAVRERLVATGDLPASGASSTDYDETVEHAVRAFQQRRGLIVDGVTGPQTYRALDGARWLLGDRLLLHTPGHLMGGDDVRALQQRLLGLGFAGGRADGVLGPLTDGALRAFQRGVGLHPDGLAGPQTLRALDRLARSVGGGAPTSLREHDRVRGAGPSLAGRVVVLDPGHCTAEPGAVSADGTLTEAEVVLDLARRVEGRLAVVGVRVVLTRGPTGAPSEAQRADLANQLDADLVLSLHCETLVRSPQAQGVATFFYGHGQTQDATGRPTGDWSATGERLATLVQHEVVARTGLLDCRSHPRSWDLLRLTQMPTVRAEVGHLSNPDDARRLATPAFRDTVAAALVAAVQRLVLPEGADAATGTLDLADVLAQARRA